MATKLSLYNGALRKLREEGLSALSDNTKARRLLDDCYDHVIQRCLEEGDWNFGSRAVELSHNTDITTQFGYSYAFEKPDDWLRTTALTIDEYGSIPLLNYEFRQGYWFSDVTPFWLWYVSNGSSYGMNLGAWPAKFEKYVHTELAVEIAQPLAQYSDSKMKGLEARRLKALREAKAHDAVNNPRTRFLPSGSWVGSRLNSGSMRGEGRYRAG